MVFLFSGRVGWSFWVVFDGGGELVLKEGEEVGEF